MPKARGKHSILLEKYSQREARYRFHKTKIFDEFLTLFDTLTEEPHDKTTHRATYQLQRLSYAPFDVRSKIRQKSWFSGSCSALRDVIVKH